MMGAKGSTGKKISMQLIADRLGVSKYTVSQALSGKPGVSESMRREVAAMARALGYRMKTDSSLRSEPSNGNSPVSAALALHRQDANGTQPTSTALTDTLRQVAVWVHSEQLNESTFWTRVLNGVITGCREHGLEAKLLLLPSEAQKPQRAEALPSPAFPGASGRTDSDSAPNFLGTIVLGTLPVTELLKVQLPGVPLILVDHEEPLLHADCVLNANLQAAQAACRHLLSKGCKSLVFIGRDTFSVSFKERWWGCRQAMDEHSRAGEGGSLKKWTLPYGQPGWEQQLAKRILSLEQEQGQLPDGFVCANDQIALSLLTVLQRHSIAVPEDCQVVGIDNIDESARSTPSLTTVELAKELLGYRAVEALVRRVHRPGYHAEKIILAARLIPRGSA